MQVSGRHLLVVVAMCGLSVATVGLITNVAGVFFTPMAQEFGVLQGVASMTLMISNICVALGGLLTRRLTKLMPLRVLLVAGTLVLAASCAGMAFAPGIAVVNLLSVTRGLSGGIIGFVLITYVLNKWFVSQLGLATSLAMGSSGLAGALFTPLISQLVADFGWRAGELLVAALTVVFCLPAIVLVPSADPADVGLRALGAGEEAEVRDAGKKAKPPIKLDRPLVVAVVGYAALSAAVSAMPQHFSGYAQEAGLTLAVGAAMVSACMVANTFGKVIMGWLCDRVGARTSVLCYTVAVLASIIALLLVRTPLAFVASALLFGLCYARATVGLSMLCRELFGKRGFGVAYPVAALGCSFSNAVFSSAVGFGFDLTGGYAVSLVVFAVFLAASAALVAWCYKRSERIA